MPLSAAGCASRRQQLIDAVDATLIVITDPRHIFYLSGMYISPLVLSGWGLNFLIIDPYAGKTTLLIHNWLEGAAQAAHVDEVIVWTWYDAKTNPGVPQFSRAIDELNLRMAIGGRRIGAEKGWLPWDTGISEVIDVTDALLAMRRQKQPDELGMIKEAISVCGAGHRAIREAIHPGMSELDVYNVIHAAMVLEAGHAVHLMGDFASGERAVGGGGPATPRVLKAGDLMICDLFPVVNGYRADYTATYSVDGKLTAAQVRLHDALHDALVAGEAMLKPGVAGREVYQAVLQAFAKVGESYAQGFRHHAGHGLGLGHPEAPFFVAESNEVIMIGDVVTLEPGTYDEKAGLGARIEHNYLITATGFERLSQHNTAFA